MPAIRLDPRTEKRLEALAKKTGRTTNSHAREALLEYLDDMEDIHLAARRLQRPARTYSAGEVRLELGL